VGSRPPKHGTLLVWSAIDKFGDRTENILDKAAVAAKVDKGVQNAMVAQVGPKITSEVATEFGAIYEKLLLPVHRFCSHFQDPAEASPGQTLQERLEQLEGRCYTLQQELDSVRRGQRSVTFGGPTPAPPGPAEGHDLGAVWDSVHAMESETATLRTKLTGLESVMSAGHVELGAYEFASKEEVQLFLEENKATDNACLFVDVVSLMNLAAQTVRDCTQGLDDQAKAKRAGFSSDAEAIIITSLRVLLPPQFSGGSKTGTKYASKKPLAAFSKYAEWDEGSAVSGRRAEVTRRLRSSVRSMGTLIKESSMGAQAKGLAEHMLTVSETFADALFTFMGQFYTELMTQYSIAAGESFGLLGRMVRRVFIDIHEVRCLAGHVNYGNVKSSDDATTIVWAALKAHMIQQAYKEARFCEHPSVSPVVLFHLYEHRVAKSVFDETIDKLEDDTASA
jgi:hypothetical protein